MVTQNRKKDSYAGGGAERHDEVRAEEILKRGLEVLGEEIEGLRSMAKNDERKQMIA